MRLSSIHVFPSYYETYFKSLDSKLDLMDLLDQRRQEIFDFYKSIPIEKWPYQYAEGKWSVKKLLRHILDAELIFCYRALAFVRGEKTSLPGWNEDEYADSVDDSNLDPSRLLASLKLQLDFTYDLFSNFSESDLKKIGMANNHQAEVGAIGFCIIAHELHHRKVIVERYLIK